MENWYAQYNNSDKVVISVGFVDPQVFVDATHSASVGFVGELPVIRDEAGNLLKKYNEATQQLEDNV